MGRHSHKRSSHNLEISVSFPSPVGGLIFSRKGGKRGRAMAAYHAMRILERGDISAFLVSYHKKDFKLSKHFITIELLLGVVK